METVRFKNSKPKPQEGAETPAKQNAPKTLKRLKIKFPAAQVKKMAVKTLQSGGIKIAVLDPPRRTPAPKRNLMDDFNANASALLPNRKGRTPLEIAADPGDIGIIEQLLRQMPDMAMPPTRSAPSALRPPSPSP